MRKSVITQLIRVRSRLVGIFTTSVTINAVVSTNGVAPGWSANLTLQDCVRGARDPNRNANPTTLGSVSSIPTGFSPVDDYYDTNRILGCFCHIKPQREPAVFHERRAYNRGNDTGRASWSSATGVEGHFQHRRS